MDSLAEAEFLISGQRVISGTLTVTIKGQSVVRTGTLAYTFANRDGAWKIEAQAWGRTSQPALGAVDDPQGWGLSASNAGYVKVVDGVAVQAHSRCSFFSDDFTHWDLWTFTMPPMARSNPERPAQLALQIELLKAVESSNLDNLECLNVRNVTTVLSQRGSRIYGGSLQNMVDLC